LGAGAVAVGVGAMTLETSASRVLENTASTTSTTLELDTSSGSSTVRLDLFDSVRSARDKTPDMRLLRSSREREYKKGRWILLLDPLVCKSE
jgi:hypothetical protein